MRAVEATVIDEVVELLEKANADLEPELMTAEEAREALALYAHIERLASHGVRELASKDPMSPESRA
jgi:hypothetical protein